ncbi:Panacea domain-containing protein [Limnothrix redekei]|uniref:Panacea domain-containing protein n=1 Tax=Limnothrix redekei LRLZ20PSL1 TaxID=3112953 RepID=A0ABW7C7N8_9CYAN
MSVDSAKLNALILYIGSNPYVQQLGVTKLWKIIYFIEVTALREIGQTITNSEFIKYEHGPVPSRGDKALKQLQREHKIHLTQSRLGQYRINQINVEETVDLADHATLSSQELEIIDRVCRTYGGKSASFLSELSHQEPAWFYAKKLEKLSPELMLYGFGEDSEGL